LKIKIYVKYYKKVLNKYNVRKIQEYIKLKQLIS
jgi:hypothetical protein